MSTPADESPALSLCPQREHLVAFAGDLRAMKELLRSISNWNLPTCPGEGKPFVQWVYTGEYTELSGSVVSLGLANDVPDLKMGINRQKLKTMD
ncbi:unnamed protein product [Alternaria sp. RS040]